MEPSPHFDALVDLLLTVGYVDGIFDQREQDFVRRYLDQLVDHLGIAAQRDHFDAIYARLDGELAALAAEVHATSDESFISNRLKIRALKLFRAFSARDQAVALELVGALVAADGSVTPIERKLHEELLAYFHAPRTANLPAAKPPRSDVLDVEAARELPLGGHAHPLLEPLEVPYAGDARPAGVDYDLIFQAITVWERQRARGNGRLAGITDIGKLPVGTRLLDGHVHVMRPGHPTELVVLGDLHGCYGCFKAALIQSDFVERARRYQEDPANNADIVLVLLGDYLDRGRFGFEGVLRTALHLLVELPNHVVMLRGNHEYLMRLEGRVVSAVTPAEAVPSIADKVSTDVLEAYRHLFEHMPTSLLFDRTLFAHGGIPRDDTLSERYRDLSSLDDAVIRFEMLWSDPADTDAVPPELQRESTRFMFGRDQFRAFMERIGCHALIRGHEQVETGFEAGFDIGGRRLFTLFSAGGKDNTDLPETSRYRAVTPMALTILRDGPVLRATPWVIDYAPFCDPAHNGHYR